MRREVDTTFDKILDLTTESSATEKCLTGIMHFSMDDLFEADGVNMVKRKNMSQSDIEKFSIMMQKTGIDITFIGQKFR